MAPLAPSHTGLASTPQPDLLWYISGPWPDKIEFRLNEMGVPEPLVDTDITGPDTEGICRIRLTDHNVSLKKDAEYEWFLSITFGETERSADFSANAAIRYVEPSDTLTKQLANTSKEKLHYVYADAGYWYDAIDSLSQLIEATPGDKALRAQRATLLNQVNLQVAAAYDANVR